MALKKEQAQHEFSSVLFLCKNLHMFQHIYYVEMLNFWLWINSEAPGSPDIDEYFVSGFPDINDCFVAASKTLIAFLVKAFQTIISVLLQATQPFMIICCRLPRH